MIKIPKFLKSITTLSLYKIGIHIDLDVDNQRLEVRCNSRWCLYYIQSFGDEQVQTELVNKRYGRVTSISFCTAGGKGEEQDEEILNGLDYISSFLKELHEGRNWQPSFQPLPLLARNTEEQMEEEGANEEIEAQMKNKRMKGDIKRYAKWAKEATLNHFIRRRWI
ncbi:MAG: hypothetical protein EZS28_045139 [Streblomastix strix]|uniref:Uncharacterized protein n=1 Tax=Streblomastix strix TaxID=222440 RepID=A0A5J4TLQ0_9EUKA|nr:MAG: hypothetical protein EZS28_045139 [Streblomastix strix]